MEDPKAGFRINPILTCLAPYFGLAAFVVVLLWPLLAGRTLYWGDILLYFEPMQRLGQEELRNGRLPLWNPYVLCGQPFIGNPQMSVFYPSTLFLLCAPVWMALSIATVVHLYLCGVFMYVFLRRWTVRALPAVAGALVYMGSAYILGRLQFPTIVQTAAFYPLLFAVLDRNIDSPSRTDRICLAIVVALTILAAHTQVAYLAFVCAIIYTVMRLWRRKPSMRSLPDCLVKLGKRRHGRRFSGDMWSLMQGLAPLTGAALMGCCLAAIYLLPAIQLLHDSPREQMSMTQANRFFADFPHVLAVLFPRFTGHPITRDFWARGNAWEPAWFVGWAPLALGAYAALACRKENLVRFWLALGLVGGWLALGTVGGLYWVAFYAVPGLSNFHDPARFLLWTTVAVSVLTAVGLDALYIRLHWQTPRSALLILGLIGLPLAWFSHDWIPTTLPHSFDTAPSGLKAIRSIAAPDRIAIPANTYNWKRVVTDGYVDYGGADARAIQRVSDTLLSNLEIRYHIESASGYEPVPVGRHVALEGLSRLALQRREPTLPRLMDLLDVRLLLMPAVGRTTVNGFSSIPPVRTTRRGALSLWSNRTRVSRAWLTRRAFRVDGRTRIAAALTSPSFDPTRTTLVSNSSAQQLGALEWADPLFALAPNSVTWRREGACLVRIHADAGAVPAMLIYSATAYPGWRAIVDGHTTSVVCADGALLGVVLPAGNHEVQFRYEPAMFRIGAYISLAAAALLAAAATFGTMRSSRAEEKRGP